MFWAGTGPLRGAAAARRVADHPHRCCAGRRWLGWCVHLLALVVDISGWVRRKTAPVWLCASLVADGLAGVDGLPGRAPLGTPCTCVRRMLALIAGAGRGAGAVLFPGVAPDRRSAWAPLHWMFGLASWRFQRGRAARR